MATTKKMTARRVIKQGNNYICGLCGRIHKFKSLADDCVEKCFMQSMSQDGVSEKASKVPSTRKKYRCSFCKRVYPSLSEAKDCVDQCKASAKNKREKEKMFEEKSRHETSNRAKLLSQLSKNATAEAQASGSDSSKIAKRGQSYVCLRCQSIYPTVREARECAERHLGPPKESYAERVAKATEAARAKNANLSRKEKEIFDYSDSVEPAKVSLPKHSDHTVRPDLKPKQEETDMFHRDGAKYTCKLCSKAHFTRDAVIQCYNSHDGAPIKKEKKAGIVLTSTKEEKEDFAKERAQKLGNVSDKDKFMRDGSKYICKACGKGFFTKMEVVKCFDGHLGIEEEEEPEESQSSSELPLARDAHLPEKQKFKRDGAKYVCRKCSKKYFTKMEVIECFNYDCPDVLPSKAQDD